MTTRMGNRLWALVPAAGRGSRLGTTVPKQYQNIAGRPILFYTLEKLIDVDTIDAIFVGIAADDANWRKFGLPTGKSIDAYIGGTSRAQTVWLGLQHLSEFATGDDWVIVHDAARPCVRVQDIETLVARVIESEGGGLLAVPERDTVKISTPSQTVQSSADRGTLWRAQTPQMFRFSRLYCAMEGLKEQLDCISDESSAMERQGVQPLLVESHEDNIKITTPEDLRLAEYLLASQRSKR